MKCQHIAVLFKECSFSILAIVKLNNNNSFVGQLESQDSIMDSISFSASQPKNETSEFPDVRLFLKEFVFVTFLKNF